MTFHEFCDAVRMYGMLTDASVTSWGRTVAHNAAVGGVTYSAHQFWLACDVVYDRPAALSDVARREMAKRLGLNLIVEGDHHHLQTADWLAG